MGETFSVRSMAGLYNEVHPPLRYSLETVHRRVGGLCEMAARLRGRESGSRGLLEDVTKKGSEDRDGEH
jgi:hypothetical protein